jgi:hypothetical protein
MRFALVGLLCVLSAWSVQASLMTCASDAVQYYTPIVECMVENEMKGSLDLISAAQCVKSIAGAETYLSACCNMFENSTISVVQDVNDVCMDFGFNTAEGPKNFMCLADFADYWDPIVLCLAAQYEKDGDISDPIACINGIEGIYTYLNACCSALESMENEYAQDIASVCTAVGLGK